MKDAVSLNEAIDYLIGLNNLIDASSELIVEAVSPPLIGSSQIEVRQQIRQVYEHRAEAIRFLFDIQTRKDLDALVRQKKISHS